MRRQTPIAHLLYNHLFPNPTSNDPVSFSAHLARNLVPEVRIEVATFYGDLNSAEARYPGLNYCHPPHRMRLGRFKHHKRLFEAFDALGLTYNEIQDFCCWEGTKWARERYEKDEGVTVKDTTGDEIKPFVDPRHKRSGDEIRRRSITRKTDISVMVEERSYSDRRRHPPARIAERDEEMQDATPPREEPAAVAASTETPQQEPPAEAAALQTHIAELERRRQQSIAQHRHRNILAAWEAGHALSPEVEQYIKEQSERGNTDLSRLLSQHRPSPPPFPTGDSAPLASRTSQAAA